MRILYLANIRFPLERANGIQTFATCHALATRGHRVRLLVRPDTHRPARDPLAFYGYSPTPDLEIATVAGPPAGVVGRLRYLAGAAREVLLSDRVDVVLTRDLGVASLLVQVPAARRPPLVYESHGFAPHVSEAMPDLLEGGRAASPAKLGRLRRRERRVWRRADAYVTITAALADELVGLFGPRVRLTTIPDGCTLDPTRRFAPLRHRDAPVVGYAGHLYPWKGVSVLLNALASLPHAQGMIIGGHPGERDLERTRAEAERLGLGARVTMTGLLNPGEVAARLADADILVLPNTETTLSARYTSPLKLFEYMAAGKPIVASRLASLEEVLEHERSALLVPPGDPAALAAAIETLTRRPGLADRLARCAFERAVDYSWDRRAARLEALLDDLVDHRPARGTT